MEYKRWNGTHVIHIGSCSSVECHCGILVKTVNSSSSLFYPLRQLLPLNRKRFSPKTKNNTKMGKFQVMLVIIITIIAMKGSATRHRSEPHRHHGRERLEIKVVPFTEEIFKQEDILRPRISYDFKPLHYKMSTEMISFCRRCLSKKMWKGSIVKFFPHAFYEMDTALNGVCLQSNDLNITQDITAIHYIRNKEDCHQPFTARIWRYFYPHFNAGILAKLERGSDVFPGLSEMKAKLPMFYLRVDYKLDIQYGLIKTTEELWHLVKEKGAQERVKIEVVTPLLERALKSLLQIDEIY